jgi:integrase
MGVVELFNRSEREPAVVIAQPISVHGLAFNEDALPSLPLGRGLAAVEAPAPALLPSSVLPSRELGEEELVALWQAATPRARAATGLLLSGLSAEEVVEFAMEDLELASRRAHVRGASPRELVLLPATADALRACDAPGGRLYGGIGDAIAEREALEADLLCAAHDAAIARADEVTPEALRHAYLLHLVRQGARMSDITAIAGRLSPHVISAYATYAPPGMRVALDATRAAFPFLERLGSEPEAPA